MKSNIIIFTACLFAWSCHHDQTDGGAIVTYHKALISGYEAIDSLFVQYDEAYESFAIAATVNGRVGAVEYERLCGKHADTAFNRKLYYTTQVLAYIETACAQDITSMQLVSDADFDDSHPAGTSLAGLAEVRTMSPKRFIDSGYEEEYPDEKIENDFLRHNIRYKWFYPIHKSMADLTPDDMTMAGMNTFIKGANRSLANFRFTGRPTLAKRHNMTLTMTTDEGKVYKAEFAVEFK